jgi:hypothetical protein
MDEYSTNNNDDLLFSLIVGLFLLEIAVGAIQVLGALIRTIIYINIKQAIGKLKNYWIMVGIYFLITISIYITQHFVLDVTTYEALSNTNDDFDKFQWSRYLMVAQVVWVFAAWGIAIWYCIKIVFVKRKNTIEINHSLTQKL